MPEAFYLPIGEARFAPTQHTVGPWAPDAQHFGPPSALLVRALERVSSERNMLLARVTIEILGPAPLTELTIESALERPGRSVELVTAVLRSNDRAIAKASGWRIATSDSTAVDAGAAGRLLPAPTDAGRANWPDGWEGGYLEAMEWRGVSGSLSEPGPMAAWVRQRVALVDGEKPSQLQRLFAVADSGNGASNRLDPRQWWFINPELTVHTFREPIGEWIGLDATTVIGPHGVGTAATNLHDENGQVAKGAQALLIRQR